MNGIYEANGYPKGRESVYSFLKTIILRKNKNGSEKNISVFITC